MVLSLMSKLVIGNQHEEHVEICTLGGVPHVLLSSLAHEGRT
jgi:hypothetical protein